MPINIGIDTASGVAALDKLKAAMAAVGGSFENMTRASATLNSAGALVRGNLDQLNEAGKRVSTTFSTSKQGILEFTQSITDAGKAGTAAGQSIIVSWQGLARVLEVQVFRRAVTAVINATRDGIQAALAFQIQLQQVGNVTGQGNNLTAFANQIRGLSDQFGSSLGDTLSAAQTAITSQGGNAAAGIDVLTASMKLARTTGVDLADATKLTTTALQGFGLASEDAARASNVLFVTAQSSRQPLTDVQRALARVGPTARDMGLDIETVGALFATVSQQGGRATQAFGQLDQILGQLRNPTQEMQRLLANVGTTSAEAGIRTFGLVGFLQRLSQNGPEALGSLNAPIRAFNAELQLSQANVARFQDNINNQRNNAGALFNADQVTANNPAVKLQEELNKFRNIFVQDIGQSVIGVFGKFNEGLGGATNSASALVNVIASAAGGMALFQASTVAANFAVGKLGDGMGKVGDIVKLTAADGALFTNTLTASFAAGQLLFGVLDQIERKQEASIARGVQLIQQQTDRTREANRINNQAATQDSTAVVNRQFGARDAIIARDRQLFDSQRQVQIDAQRQVQDAYKVTAQSFIDNLQSSITRSQQIVSQAATHLTQSNRAQQSFAENIQNQQFQRNLGVEQDPVAAIQLLQARFQQLQRSREATFNDPRSTNEQIQVARQQGAEQARISGELQQREQQIQVARDTQNGALQRSIVLGREVLSVRVDTSAAIAREGQLIADNDRFEQAHRDNIAKDAAKAASEVARQQNDLRTFESSVRRVEQFRATTDTGELAVRFRAAEQQTPGGGAAQARQQFEVLARQIRASGQGAGLSEDNINTLITQARTNLEGELALLERRNVLDARAVDNARQRLQIQTSINSAQANILRDQNTLTTETSRVSENLRSLNLPTRAIDPNSFTLPLNAQARDALGRVNTAIGARDDLTAARSNLNANRTPENLQRFNDALQAIIPALQGLRGIGGGVANRLGLQTFGATVDPFGNQITFQERLNRVLDRANLQAQGGESGGVTFRPLADELQNLLADLGQNQATVDALNRELAGANPAAPLDQAAQAAGRLAANLDLLNQRLAAPAPAPQAGFNAIGGNVVGFPGSPRGTDTVPYWLSPGEYIMDAKNTSKFYTQLVSMSSGQAPQYAAKGGVVVGDINITANMNSVNEKSVRQLGRAINREIKRGTISFGQ